jgi:hypothetical protein
MHVHDFGVGRIDFAFNELAVKVKQREILRL